MADVTGMTAAAIDALMDEMVIGFHLDENGQLIYETRGGAEGNAGPIISPQLAVEASHPIGSIFISAVNTNPNTLLGMGVWARFGQGRTLVSLDEAQTEFDTNGETGGAKTVTLVSTEVPQHDHDMAHTHPITASYTAGTSDTGAFPRVASWNFGSAGDVDRTGDTGQPANVATANRTGKAGGNAGDGTTSPHNNLPPYIVVYMWKRTA